MDSVTYEGRDLEAMSFAVNYYRWVLSEIASFLGLRVIEAGAGSGNFTSLLLTTPVQKVLALEPSNEMFPLLAQKFASEPRVESSQAFFSDIVSARQGQFDSVVYINVLEHVEHDADELKKVYEALPPGGTVCIFVPALPFLYSSFDASVGHYRRYTKKYLCQVLVEAGFKIEKLHYMDVAGIVPWYLFFTLGGQTLGAKGTSAYDRLVIPFMRLAETIVRPPMGKNLLAVGRKPK